MKLNPHLVKSTVVAALGGLLFGFDTAVIAGTTGALRETYHLSPGSLGLTVAIALWGTVVGGVKYEAAKGQAGGAPASRK